MVMQSYTSSAFSLQMCGFHEIPAGKTPENVSEHFSEHFARESVQNPCEKQTTSYTEKVFGTRSEHFFALVLPVKHEKCSEKWVHIAHY